MPVEGTKASSALWSIDSSPDTSPLVMRWKRLINRAVVYRFQHLSNCPHFKEKCPLAKKETRN